MKLGLLLVTVLLGMVVAPPRGTAQRTGLIRIVGVMTGRAVVNEDGPRLSAGDTLYVGLSLRSDRNSRKRLGYGAMECVSMGKTLPGHVSLCRGVYVLPLGKIAFAGTRQRTDLYSLAVIGGSGLYSHVGGSLVASRTTDRNSLRFTILISLE